MKRIPLDRGIALGARLGAPLASLLLLALGGCRNEVAPAVEEGPLAQAFRLAAAETGVPAELLMAIGWVETRWQPAAENDAHDEGEHGPRAAGLMDFDCASSSQTCGWQNDDIGNNCL